MTRPAADDDYNFIKWEFEQKFTSGAYSAAMQPIPNVREFANMRIVGIPTFTSTVDGFLKSGCVEIYYNDTLITTIENPHPSTGNMFGKAVSIMKSPTGNIRAILVASNTRVYLLRRSEESFSMGANGYPEYWNTVVFDGTEPPDYHIEFIELKTPSNASIPGPTEFFDMELEFLTSAVRISIPLLNIVPKTRLPSADSAITKQAISGSGKVAAAMEYGNGYAWAIANTPVGYTHHMCSVTRVDYWHYATVDSTDTLEKLTYHYYLDNNNLNDYSKKASFYVGRDAAEVKPELVSMAKNNDTLYFNIGDRKIFSFNMDSGLFTETILVPDIQTGMTQSCTPEPIVEHQTILSNICVAYGMLYFVSAQLTSDERQRLWRYDLTNKTWSYTILPGRHQSRPRHIVDGYDGDIWITNYNNHSIIRANGSTGAIIATVRINRHPYQLVSNQAKEIYIASDCDTKSTARKFYAPSMQGGVVKSDTDAIVQDNVSGYKVVITKEVSNGQINLLNQADNSVEPFCGGTVKSLELPAIPDGRIYDDGRGHLWFIDNAAMGKLEKATLHLKLSYPSPEDAKFDKGVWTDADENKYDSTQLKEMIPGNATIDYNITGCIASVVTPMFTYDHWNGAGLESVNVKPYLVWTSNGTSFAIVRCSALVRKSKYKHRATGMIAIGEQSYIGDGNL